MSSHDLNWCRAYPCSTVSACTTSGAASLHPVWGVFGLVENETPSATNVSESVIRNMLYLVMGGGASAEARWGGWGATLLFLCIFY